MSYETNPAGLGVGKTYGPKAVGGLEGQPKTSGFSKEIVFEFTAGAADEVLESIIIQDYYLVTGLTLEVDEAFAASSTANMSIDGGAGLTTALALATAGISAPALTGLAKASGAGPVDVVLTLNANAKASAAGKGRLVVKYAIA